jgi:two-component system cell cycle response regulator
MSIKILIVDDSKVVRLSVLKALEPYDCTALEAENGATALDIASREKPDAVLLDYNMPVMDGFELLSRIRVEPTLKATPVIMLTTLSDRETVMKIARLGVREYLVKPFKEEMLIERLGRVVRLNPKAAVEVRAKRHDDPIHVLVVDNPAIVEQIRLGLAGTPWTVSGAGQPGEALDLCVGKGVDVVLASLSLPNDGALTLFQNLRSHAGTSAVPVFGLCVKTIESGQSRATEAGFAGIITKPIQGDKLKARICRALKLETAKYLEQRPEAVVLVLHPDYEPALADEVTSKLTHQLTALVDAGGDRLIVDFSALHGITLPLIQLVISALRVCGEYSIRYAMVGSEAIRAECRKFEESNGWAFGGTFEEALAKVK